MNNNNKIFLYGECYAVITVALFKKQNNDNVTVITINNNVKKFCDYCNINCIYFERIPLSIKTLYNIFRFKHILNNLIRVVKIDKEDEFYIIDNAFVIEGFYLVSLLKNKTNLYYYKTIEESVLYKISEPYLYYFYHKINKLLLSILLKINLILYSVNNKPVIGVNSSFLEKNKVVKNSELPDYYEMKKLITESNLIKSENYDIMFADQGELEGIIINDSFNYIMDLLAKTNIVIKEHPNFKRDKIFDTYDKYPDYIPSEFLFNNINKFVISIYSTTLVIASQTEKIKAISLLDIVNWINPKYKENVKNRLIKESNNKIIFVTSINELEKLIKG